MESRIQEVQESVRHEGNEQSKNSHQEKRQISNERETDPDILEQSISCEYVLCILG